MILSYSQMSILIRYRYDTFLQKYRNFDTDTIVSKGSATCDSKTLISTKWLKSSFWNNSKLMVGKESNKELQLSFEKACPNIVALLVILSHSNPFQIVAVHRNLILRYPRCMLYFTLSLARHDIILVLILH